METIRQYLNCVQAIVFCIVRLSKVENFQIIWKQGEVWIIREETEYVETTLFPHNKEFSNFGSRTIHKAIPCAQFKYGVILISNFRHVLNVVCFLMGNSPASEFYMPTFRNPLFHLHGQVGVEWLGLRNVGVFIREKVWLENSLSL